MGAKECGRKRRLSRDSKKFKFPEVSKEKTNKILNAKDVEELRKLQISREVTSADIVAVYSQRAHTIGRQLNLVTEEYYNEALIEAKKKDEELTKALKENKVSSLGRLHGIPVSIKDHIGEKGRISTVGAEHFADFISEEDAGCVQLIRKEGGIPFVKSNNP